MNESEAFIELFGRVAEHVHAVVDGLTAVDLAGHRHRARTRSVGWSGT